MDFKNETGAIANETINKPASGNGVAKNANSKPTPANPKADLPAKNADESTQPAPNVNEPAKSEVQASTVLIPTLVPMSLNDKLKIVNDLHRKSIQRMNLITRIKQLEEFEVNLATENDELSDNPYQGCRLIIKDDRNREFVTTTPGLIRLVSQLIFDACNKKLSEIETAIQFPD